MSVVFITRDEATEVLEPSDGSLDLPSSPVAAELPPVLSGRLFAVLAVRTHEFNPAFGQPCSQRIAVGGLVVDQSTRLGGLNAPLKKRFDERHFMGTGAGDLCTEGKAMTIGEDHDLAALAALRLTYKQAPFSPRTTCHRFFPIDAATAIERAQ